MLLPHLDRLICLPRNTRQSTHRLILAVLSAGILIVASPRVYATDGEEPSVQPSTSEYEATLSFWSRVWTGGADCVQRVRDAADQAYLRSKAAKERAAAILASFTEVLSKVSVDGIETASGGASGLKQVLISKVVCDAPFIAWRVFSFEPNTEGLKSQVFDPMTRWVTRLTELDARTEGWDRYAYAEAQMVLYGELIVLFFETSLKAQKIVPQQAMRLVPAAVNALLPIPLPFVKAPHAIDELAFNVLKSLLANTWKAISTRGLTLRQRFASITLDELALSTGSRFADDAGITALIQALAKYRKTPNVLEAIESIEFDEKLENTDDLDP